MCEKEWENSCTKEPVLGQSGKGISNLKRKITLLFIRQHLPKVNWFKNSRSVSKSCGRNALCPSKFPRKELFLGIRIIGISLEESESELLLPTLFSFCFPFISLSLELSSLSKYISLSFEFNSSVVVSTLSLVPSPWVYHFPMSIHDCS